MDLPHDDAQSHRLAGRPDRDTLIGTRLSWVILGLVADSLAKFLVPGRDLPRYIVTTLLGTAGAFAGVLPGSTMAIAQSPGAPSESGRSSWPRWER